MYAVNSKRPLADFSRNIILLLARNHSYFLLDCLTPLLGRYTNILINLGPSNGILQTLEKFQNLTFSRVAYCFEGPTSSFFKRAFDTVLGSHFCFSIEMRVICQHCNLSYLLKVYINPAANHSLLEPQIQPKSGAGTTLLWDQQLQTSVRQFLPIFGPLRPPK